MGIESIEEKQLFIVELGVECLAISNITMYMGDFGSKSMLSLTGNLSTVYLSHQLLKQLKIKLNI